MRKILIAGAALSAILGVAGAASASGFFTNGVPVAGGSQYPSTIPLTGNETFPADTNLPSGLNPASEAITGLQLQTYLASGVASTGYKNALIGGDAYTNLWQRGTSVGSITTTATYTADRLFAWGGTNTTVTVSQDTTAAELSQTFNMAFKVQKTGTGVVPVCVAQVVNSTMAVAFQGLPAEFDFHAAAGAGFSAAGGTLSAYIISGTGVNEGSANMAFGLNGGGGSSTAWTGQINILAGTVTLTPSGGQNRYVGVGAVPLGAKELGVAICWTPVGASPSNDYIALEGLQLARNQGLVANAGKIVISTAIQASPLERRSQELENILQYRYYYQITEPASVSQVLASCEATSTTAALCAVPTPVPMRSNPTVTCTFGTLKVNIAGTATAITACAATAGASGPTNAAITTTVASGQTAGQVEQLVFGNSTGGGIIAANSEL